MLFTQCSTIDHKFLRDVGVKCGKIVHLADHSNGLLPESREVVDLQGKLLLPGLVETHIHLDKALLLDRLSGDVTTLQGAIAKSGELKRFFTAADINERSLRVIRQAVIHGVTRMRCHVEVDPVIGLIGMETILALKERLKDVIDLQIVAFPQEGIFRDCVTQGLMEQAVSMGADVVGGITYNDRNLEEHLDFVFRLAHKHGLPVDLHADFSDRPEQLAILEVVKTTEKFGMQGRVSVGHLTSLGVVRKVRAEAIAEAIAEAGIHVMCLPATDLYLNGRGVEQAAGRGLTPVQLLLDKGVNVVFGSNNIQNAFTPFGTADPLDIGLLVAQTSHMGSEKDAGILVEMATTRAATALELDSYGLRIGADADLVVCQATDVRSLLYTRSEREKVYKKGKLIAETLVSSNCVI
ncbi:amidohydrolase family protein [Cohnella sp. NL03-T5]|nr:amidohydrolase family protein [Cohnella silvisoli]